MKSHARSQCDVSGQKGTWSDDHTSISGSHTWKETTSVHHIPYGIHAYTNTDTQHIKV